ncbi:hypothetical protein P171DRAFT_266427 [Karstenula rhodostoma CBS 690.94]|uniref:histidine kinase n=1 Tax=Karstenula rhodostoma CBS 690.94 TaxID=1392251 RepID=A0A9P4UCU0_9PLEO|nr:hypothetical protein P171DRAFT_266427 [Karstenula rhodostoma CBS 690.94]
MNRAPLPSPNSRAPVEPTDVTVQDSASSHPAARPLLQRFPASNPEPDDDEHEHAHPQARDEDTTDPDMSDSADEGSVQAVRDASEEPQEKSSPDELEIERLRSLQLKTIQKQQQRARMQGAGAATAASRTPLGGRRPSPIKEEPASTLSPTLEGAFSSPLPTAQTASTESTESARTIRGSVPPTPASRALRTPSYPFPTVPNTPAAWSSAFHQPFTALSPTVSAMYGRDYAAPRERVLSESSTPAASGTPFSPGQRPPNSPHPEDPRFPSPNLYELVLSVNLEPGLAAWWSNVTKIMYENYGVERATLAVPADPSDIENVPWGQKCTFQASAQGESPRMPAFQEAKAPEKSPSPESEVLDGLPPVPIIPDRRPKLPSRHSYAGHERHKRDSPDSPMSPYPQRPRGLLRTVSHAPQTATRAEHPLRQVLPMSYDGTSFQHPTPTPPRVPTFSDPDFSSVGGAETSSPVAVFPVLRALDHEPDTLIDNSGVNRVLESGRVVTLTRDYSPSFSSGQSSSDSSHEDLPRSTTKSHGSAHDAQRPSVARTRTGPASKTSDQGDRRLQPRYEEYEQFPTSPWAQSPAPSPAIQNDASENPFFTTSNVDEETFNPSSSNQDYTQYGIVEAIGIDKASTITHIPLIHPTLSQTMQAPEPGTPSHVSSLSGIVSEQSVSESTALREGFERKAPIAILSILSPIVPYPRNLTNSLKHFGPHLATCFSNAWQFSNAQAQASGNAQQRFGQGQPAGLAPMGGSERLSNLMHLDLENIGNSTGGSVTSPSDYSGRSRPSPGGSIAGTPGWDASALGPSSKQSVISTPGYLAGSEAVESYFDSKKRSTRGQSASQEQNRKPEKHAGKKVNVTSVPETLEDDVPTPRNEKGVTEEALGSRKARMVPQGHSLLHSYGADFSSSFQSLPTATATTPGVRTPLTPAGHGRTRSVSETQHAPIMPPPSENLLRTIIDSLPVQTFTALPTTGALTWVNSKFLIYRGQEQHQVLQGPWDTIHPDDRKGYLEQWNKSLRTGQQMQKKVRLRRFDNLYRWFYVRVAPLKNKRGQIVHWIGTNMDFHEQHLAEINSARQQETAASEAKYRALANSSPQVVFVVSDRRGLTFCNSQWESYSGQTETQAHGNGFLEHVHPEDVIKCKLPEMSDDGSANVPTSMPTEHARQDSSSSDDSSETEKTITSPGSSPDRMDMPQAKLSRLAGTGILRIKKDADGRASYSTEVRLRNKAGEYRWHLVRILLEKELADDSEEETWYGTATDINDHKLLEQTLKETMDAKGRFLSNMSHEIRTPLNGISGMVNFLLDSPLNPEQLEHVNIIKASTDSLLNLINDILDLSKVEAGMIKLTMEWLHLPSLLEEVNDLNMGLAIQKGLELNYVMDEGVPLMVKGDKFRLRQVLLNVVGNAIKFTQKGEIFVRCRLQPSDKTGPLASNETMIRFEVIDTGLGFTENEAKYLFKRFSQIDASSTRQHGGTGLGLAISMQFVELHGGRMDAQSIPGKGSTFFFTIKFGLPSEDDYPQPKPSTPSTPALEPSIPVPPLPMQPAVPSSKFAQPPHLAQFRHERFSSSSSEKSESVKSPVPSLTASERSRSSPSLSSGSSDHSLTSAALTGKSSLRSERSSASSFLQESTLASIESEMKLALPPKRSASEDSPMSSGETVTAIGAQRSLSPLGSSLQPPMYSILVVCPLVHSREATIRHIKQTLPTGIPHQVTGQSSLVEAQRMIGGDDPVLFTHVVLVLHETTEVISIMDQILNSMVHGNASIVVVSDPAQKKELMNTAPMYDYNQLLTDRRLQFIYRPLKPSKFAVIFDPQKERESSTDRNQDSAQQVVFNQKLVFEELKRRLGDKGHKVLLVEDNHINQTVRGVVSR